MKSVDTVLVVLL